MSDMRLRSAWTILMLSILAGLAITLSTTEVSRHLGVVWARPTAAPTAPPPAPTAMPATAASVAATAIPATATVPATATPVPEPWRPQIAFQFYDTQEVDADFLASRVDWLMMRYGAEHLRDEVIAAGYDNILPQYLLLFQIQGPGPYRNSDDECKNHYTPQQNNVMWTSDFCQLVHEHEDWFLHNRDGERLYTREQIWNGRHVTQYYMNPGAEGFRQFWIEQVRLQDEAGWQSLFLDNVAATYAYIGRRADNGNGEGDVAEYSSVDEWQGAVIGMLREIRAGLPGRPIWGNVIEAPPRADAWDRYIPELDGIQEESFATGWLGQSRPSAAAWEAMLGRAERTLAAGKSVVLYGQGEEDDEGRMGFSLASYLLVATPDKRATFRYAHSGDYDQLWWYPQYDQPIGSPLGPRYRDGELWARDFTCARVTVDPRRHEGTIEARSCEMTN
jgi:hypothetical protein